MLYNIEAERARKGMTKSALAQALGVTHKTYNGYINGTPIPSDVLVSMARIFDCKVDYLLGLTDTHQ